jgi:hypothetical protein
MRAKHMFYLQVSGIILMGTVVLLFGAASLYLSSDGNVTDVPVGTGAVASPEVSTGANLRIDVVIEETTDHGLSRHPLPGVNIERTILQCPIEMPGPGESPSYMRLATSAWCGTRPLNPSAETNENGEATLWFHVDPPPSVAKPSFLADPVYRYKNAPSVSIYNLVNDGCRQLEEKMSMFALEYWQIRILLECKK